MSEKKLRKPYAPWVIGEETYRLKLSAGATVDLEQRLGKGIMSAMADITSVKTQTMFLWAALQKYHHGIDLAATYALYDQYLDDGAGYEGVVQLIMEVLRASGFIPEETAETETLNPTPAPTSSL